MAAGLAGAGDRTGRIATPSRWLTGRRPIRLLVRKRPAALSRVTRGAWTSRTVRPAARARAMTAARVMPSSTPQSKAGVIRASPSNQNRLAASAQATSPWVLSIRAASAPARRAARRARTLSRYARVLSREAGERSLRAMSEVARRAGPTEIGAGAAEAKRRGLTGSGRSSPRPPDPAVQVRRTAARSLSSPAARTAATAADSSAAWVGAGRPRASQPRCIRAPWAAKSTRPPLHSRVSNRPSPRSRPRSSGSIMAPLPSRRGRGRRP